MFAPSPWRHTRLPVNRVPNKSPWSFTTRYLTSGKSAASVGPYHSCPVALWSLSAYEQLQCPHHQRHIRCLSTLHRTSVQLSKSSNATHSERHMGQPGCGRRLPQPGQLTIGEELLGYHNNNNNNHVPTSLREYLPSLSMFGYTWRSGCSCLKDGALRSPQLCCGWSVNMELVTSVAARPLTDTDIFLAPTDDFSLQQSIHLISTACS